MSPGFNTFYEPYYIITVFITFMGSNLSAHTNYYTFTTNMECQFVNPKSDPYIKLQCECYRCNLVHICITILRGSALKEQFDSGRFCQLPIDDQIK